MPDTIDAPAATPYGPPVAASTDLLFIDHETVTQQFVRVLSSDFRVAVTATATRGREFLNRLHPTLVVTELDLADGNGIELCREAKALRTPPCVLVTTTTAERVPDALDAGCDGVLLKPFAPNLLRARIGRLLRAHVTIPHDPSTRVWNDRAHAPSRALSRGTNHVWPDVQCPHCERPGVTSFEFASHRRWWYACRSCRKVWIDRRRE